VKEGEINGVDVPIFNWDFVDSETVGMIVSKPLTFIVDFFPESKLSLRLKDVF